MLETQLEYRAPIRDTPLVVFIRGCIRALTSTDAEVASSCYSNAASTPFAEYKSSRK
ncbi:hypothetical protein TESG_08497 [Trichophyton tonsurans CBS 112818]|uniref:Uncharacterized protein n=2 Tax=Trichophyton TaxID=5550 RepID=F2PQR4_TRIEC|nr:hypothetical protein TESG_08497 [Trichophyton tonsurans CBS 112818]EGE04232.1 hypothetical protein TEQG_08654 [Trichophyton equinum CBS 127.97]